MIRLNDYETSEGQIDWDAYRQAQLDAGERCQECSGPISEMGRPPGTPPFTCMDCRRLRTGLRGEQAHLTRVRCPECLHQSPVQDFCPDAYHVEQIDWSDIEATCPQCSATFHVRRRVDVDFVSPPAKQSAGAAS